MAEPRAHLLAAALALAFLPAGAALSQYSDRDDPGDGLDGPKAARLFGEHPVASLQAPAAYGSYSKGCLAGGELLPETGPTWQAMRLSRNRNWGHPVTVAYVKDLSRTVAALDDWAGLYVGDIGQPRGGPILSDHRSHQIGLDVDIWLMPPERLDLSRREREELSARSVRSRDHRDVNDYWRESHMEVLKAAAEDPRVDRIFITAPAKIWMCENAGADRAWLQRIRPYWGHHYHFHVRLKCPESSAGCKTQIPTVAELSKGGDGCDESLRWWVTAALKPPDPDAPKPPKRRGPADYVMAELPAQCQAVLESP